MYCFIHFTKSKIQANVLYFESFITSDLQLLKLPLCTYLYPQIYPNNPGTDKLLCLLQTVLARQ